MSCASSANDHVLQSFEVFSDGKISFSNRKNWCVFFFSEKHNSRLNRKGVAIPRKNVGLWLEFALFGS